jgi:hypothetical protein
VLSRIATTVLVACFASAATAGSVEQWLRKLDPEERARQTCMLKGLKEVQRNVRLASADRMQSSIFSSASLQGDLLVANGGAVRVKGRWYALSFKCQLTSDRMAANNFAFKLGDEIPKQKWDDFGLW